MAKKDKSEMSVTEKASENTFLVVDILKSNQFTPIQKDFLKAILDSDKRYTLAETSALLEKKLKGAVK